jgi:hypothetical protein
MRIRRAKREIAKLLSPRLANVRVFSTPGASWIKIERIDFVIATDTEKQAESLRRDYPTIYPQLCEAMIRVGYSATAIPLLRFPVWSQETVDRENAGSWREALWAK